MSTHTSCDLVRSFEGRLKEEASEAHHLHRYLHDLDEKKQGTPLWVDKPTKEMAREELNVIYPVSKDVFIHIYGGKHGERKTYHPVEPASNINIGRMLSTLEEILAYRLDKTYDYHDSKEQTETLKNLIKEVVIPDPSIADLESFQIEGKHWRRKIRVNPETSIALEYLMIRDKVGVGVIEPMIQDPYIEDISCDGIGPIFVEHKLFRSCKSSITFKVEDELDDYVKRLSDRIGKPVSYRTPIIDGTLPDGSRINLVYGKMVSRKGSNFTIRKFSDIPTSITQLCSWNTLDCTSAAYLWMLIESGTSVWISGETASGKTTTMKALCAFMPPASKIVSVEDTPEVVVPHDNWVREVTKDSEGEEGKVELFDLLKACLRQRPDYIIVGEIRGREGNVAFQAMQTGHPVMSTFHASSVEKLIQRLTGSPIEVPKTYIDNIGAVVIQSAVRVPYKGTVERRVISVNEIVGYDPIEDRFNFIELITWDPITDTFRFKGEGSSYLLESKIAPMYGLSNRDVRKIYTHLDNRAKLLSLLVKAHIFDYYDLWAILKKTSELGVEKALELMRTGRLVQLPQK